MRGFAIGSKNRSTGSMLQGSELFLMPLGPMVAGLYAAGVLDMGSQLTHLLVLTTLNKFRLNLLASSLITHWTEVADSETIYEEKRKTDKLTL